MKQSEAVRVIGILNAYFPARPLPTETVALWATEIIGFAFEDALTAARDIGTNARFMPALSELVAEIRDAQAERERALRPALPAGEESGFVGFTDWQSQHATPAERSSLTRFFNGLKARKGE